MVEPSLSVDLHKESMSRRCNNGMCLTMASARIVNLDLPVATVLASPRSDWGMITSGVRMRVAHSIEVDWKKFNQDDYLFSHCSIVASVATKDDGHTIIPACVGLVNNNGNAWTNEVLLATFKTFIGGENYLEHCFPSGTRVLMSDGTYKEIQEIQPGEMVVNRLGVPDRVKNLQKRTSNELIRISSTDILSRDLFVTSNHPFWVYHARETCPKTGRPNGFDRDKDFCHLDKWIGFSRGVHKKRGEIFGCGVQPKWINAGDLNPNRDFVTHPVSDLVVENPEINENRAELIGWFLAEGSYSHTNQSSDEDSGVIFNLGNDERDVAERIKKLLTVEFGDLFRTDCEPRIRESESGSITVGLSNKLVAEFFFKWCGKYAWAKKLHADALWLPKNLQALILKHCVSGDGTGETESRGYSIEMKSRSLIQQLLFVSWRLGLCPTYRETGVLPRYTEMEIADGYEIFTEPATGKKSRPGFGLWFSVGDSKSLNVSSLSDDSRIAERASQSKTHILSTNDGKWIVGKIDGIFKEKVECEVFNLEVENDNSYIAEGVIVHNCQIPELSKGKILDAVARPVHFKDEKGRKADIYYIDILVGTNRKHDELVSKIASGKLTTMSMGCGIAGTPVLMADGVTKPLENVVVGDKVFTHTGGIAEVESTRVRQTVPGELRRLSLTGIPDTYVTGEHPYWALVGYDVCIGCGKEMGRSKSKPWALDQILHPWCSTSCRQSRVNSNAKDKVEFKPVAQKVRFEWVPVVELRKGDYVAVPLGRQQAQRQHIEEYKARLLGYYAAEGNLQRAGNGDVRAVEFSLHADEPAGDEIVSLAKAWGVADERIYSQIRNRKAGRSRRIVVHDKEMANWLKDNCGEHCDGKRFAPWVMELDDDGVLDVLGAYVSGDGHCRKNDARFTTASCSKALSEQVLFMMMAMGIPSNMSVSKPKGKKMAWYVNTRKGHAGVLAGRTFKFRTQIDNKSKVSSVGGYMLRRVTANESVDLVCDVFNIHVKNEAGDHSYVMNGVAVHNCIAEYVTCSKCGKVMGDNDPNCKHIDEQMLQHYTDDDGDESVVSELCGRMIKKNGKLVGDPKSCRFIEASWVDKPAFVGAVLNHYVSEIPKAAAKILAFSAAKLDETVSDMFKMRVADKMGMMVLRIARDELMRRKREAMIERIIR